MRLIVLNDTEFVAALSESWPRDRPLGYYKKIDPKLIEAPDWSLYCTICNENIDADSLNAERAIINHYRENHEDILAFVSLRGWSIWMTSRTYLQRILEDEQFRIDQMEKVAYYET